MEPLDARPGWEYHNLVIMCKEGNDRVVCAHGYVAMGCIGLFKSMDHRFYSLFFAVTWHGCGAVGLTRHWNHDVLDMEARVQQHTLVNGERERGKTKHASCWRRRQHNCMGVEFGAKVVGCFLAILLLVADELCS
jgi:hypothetical protein